MQNWTKFPHFQAVLDTFRTYLPPFGHKTLHFEVNLLPKAPFVKVRRVPAPQNKAYLVDISALAGPVPNKPLLLTTTRESYDYWYTYYYGLKTNPPDTGPIVKDSI